jgi:hypothetical protein
MVETPKPLEGKALEAATLFQEIGDMLALQPSITLTADLIDNQGNVTLTWSSTGAQTVSIVNANESKNVLTNGKAKGSITTTVSTTTTFTATATGPRCSAKAIAVVTFSGGVIP